jgi:hypothetical protein
MGQAKEGTLDDSNTMIERALGVKWDSEADHLFLCYGI